MHHYIDKVKDYPPPLGEAFDGVGFDFQFPQFFEDVVCNRDDVPVRSPRADEEIIGNVCDFSYVQEFDVFCFFLEGIGADVLEKVLRLYFSHLL